MPTQSIESIKAELSEARANVARLEALLASTTEATPAPIATPPLFSAEWRAVQAAEIAAKNAAAAAWAEQFAAKNAAAAAEREAQEAEKASKADVVFEAPEGYAPSKQQAKYAGVLARQIRDMGVDQPSVVLVKLSIDQLKELREALWCGKTVYVKS